jgi:hypothetical protein
MRRASTGRSFEEEQRAIVHDYLDRHYRDTLDQPVLSLGNKSPRAAVKTASGRAKVADWLKMMENRRPSPTVRWRVTASTGCGRNWASPS